MYNHFKTIFIAGSAAGVLDLSSAVVRFGMRGITATRILQHIASGLLGARSYQGGAATALLGCGLHFLIAISAAGVYYAASHKLRVLLRYPVWAGLLFGISVFVFMNEFVLPLSAVVPNPKVSASEAMVGAAILAFLFGLPISLIVWQARGSVTVVPGQRFARETAQSSTR